MSRDAILDAAEVLLQQRGVKAMSYADISVAVGLGKPAIHHHFPTKANLIEAVAERYLAAFHVELEAIKSSGQTIIEQLLEYAELFRACYHTDENMCLFGMLAANVVLLSDGSEATVNAFYEANTGFLEQLISAGQGNGLISSAIEPAEVAALIFSSLQGGLLYARTKHSSDSLDRIIAGLPTLVRAP